MVGLFEYIFESARTTSSNSERKKELEAWLKNKKYPDYVETLNKMLDDPKAKSLLQDGFGGELGNYKLKFAVKEIPAQSLRPTQAEIDVSKSIKHGLTKIECLKKDFDEPIIINNMPLITFRGNYVIDGHHRWAETVIINPSGKMVCFDYDGDISPIQMLKAIQGAIAAVMADDNDNSSKLPSGKVQDTNLFDMSEEDLSEYVNSTIINDVCIELVKQLNNDDIKSQDDVIQYIIDNMISMQNNNYPEDGMPNRGEMPQTDKAGTIKGDKSSSFPDKDGSALNKLKTGKIDKDALK